MTFEHGRNALVAITYNRTIRVVGTPPLVSKYILLFVQNEFSASRWHRALYLSLAISVRVTRVCDSIWGVDGRTKSVSVPEAVIRASCMCMGMCPYRYPHPHPHWPVRHYINSINLILCECENVPSAGQSRKTWLVTTKCSWFLLNCIIFAIKRVQ